MLHNSEPYGPSETPVNMAAPMNITSNGHINIASNNINHLAKLGHSNTPSSSGPFGLGDYSVYHHQHFNMASQMAQFQNHQYQHLGFPPNYSNSNPGSTNNRGLQNGMLPMNLNIHNEFNTNFLYPYDKRFIDSSRPEVIKEQNLRKVPLNIPQIPNKVLPKQPLFSNDYHHNDSYHHPSQNLDLSMKPQDRLEISSSRRKKIENTVKMIENLLIHSANTPKTPMRNLDQEIYDKKFEDDYGDTDPLKTSPIRLVTDPTETSASKTDPVPLSLTPVESRKQTVHESNSILKSLIQANSKIPHTDDQKPSDVEVIKPEKIPLEKSPQNDPIALSDNSIVIKIENASWTDTEYGQPFFQDCYAFQRDSPLDTRIIDGDTSVSEALIAIKNIEFKSEGCYECPHCGVLFMNPKRFLIHTKWHTFGLTNEKRTELLREREERRNQRKEAKIVERMNAKEVTEDVKVEGKTWPCKDCDKIFSGKGSLKNHRQREHPARARECRICHKHISGWISLRTHMATHAGEAGVGFQCSQCPKRFKYSHSLAKHSDTHLEKVHACSDCPKKFGSQALLKMHMKTHERHSRGATFRCTYCAKGFFESYSLQVHERTHRNERPFQCDICNTSYGTNSSLKRHLKVSHSTMKPYECSVCHRSFSTEPIRDRHAQRAHSNPEDFKFPCKLCHCKYLKLKDLQKHFYKAHPKNKRRKKVKSENEQEEYSE